MEIAYKIVNKDRKKNRPEFLRRSSQKSSSGDPPVHNAVSGNES